MIDPVAYRELDSEPVSWFTAMATPDGWRNAHWSGVMPERLTPDETAEFVKLIKDFLRICPDNIELAKLFRKYGKRIRSDGMDPTIAFIVEKPLMDYVAEATGPNLWVEAHRKEKES